MSFENRDTPETHAKYMSGLPLNRLAQPVEVSRLALYLASDESLHVTGGMFPIDAGACAL